MKKVLFFLTLGIASIFIPPLSAQSRESNSGTATADSATNYICGLDQIIKHQKQAVRRTLRSHPEIPPELAKIEGIQYEVGDTVQFYTYNFESNSFDNTSAVCRHKTDKTYIFVGLPEWDREKVTQDIVDRFHEAFDVKTPAQSLDPNKGIREILETTFGSPPNRSNDGYVYILIYDVKDGYQGGKSNSFIAGFFNPNDQGTGSFSNRKDIIYVDCDPANPTSANTLGTIAHEYQHLLHYARDRHEQTWVNEGASEYAQFLTGFGLRDYLYPRYLQHPNRSLIAFGGIEDILIDYGKVSLWTYYLGEKFGTELISQIVRDIKQGVAGVQSALNKQGISLSFNEIFSNFVVANYADDPSLDENGFYGYQHLNFSMLPKISNRHPVYPVDQTRNSLERYAAAYHKFLAVDSTAVLHFSGPSSGPIRAQILKLGEGKEVTRIALDANNQGEYPLNEIGKSVSEILLIPTSLDNSISYNYSVSTEIEDLFPPRITSGPIESLPTGSSITISWETDELATSILDYGLTSNYEFRSTDTNFVTVHRIILANLLPNTVYHYRVGSQDVKGNGPTYSIDFSFSTKNLSVNTVTSVQQYWAHAYQGRNLVRTSDDIVHLVFHVYEEPRRFVVHTQSSDNGTTWSSPQKVDSSFYYGGMPSLAVDSKGYLHVAWHARDAQGADNRIYYSRSNDGGITWKTPILLSTSFQGKDQLYPAVAIDPDDNPHVVWNSALTNHLEGDVYHNYSPDGGDTWQTDKMISTSSNHTCFSPTIDFTSSGKAYVFFVDGIFNDRTRNAFFVASEDYLNWTAQQAVSTSGVLFDDKISFVIDHQDRIHVVFPDNFQSGIHIMYTRLENDLWQAPTSIAESVVTGGFVSYPNIAVDENDKLYVVYRDNLTPSSLGKLYQKAPIRQEASRLEKSILQEHGDIFLIMNDKKSWLPATNLSSDNTDSDYPEMPRSLLNGIADVIWMNRVTDSFNELKFLHYNTAIVPNFTPPQVTAVFPPDGAVDVPYFKETFHISVDFDQRIEIDSLITGNVVITDSANQPIVGEITYQESLRRMLFTPAADLSPDERITVRLTTHITNRTGVGLDGNKNGIAEGSPTDDFVWSFHTRPLDTDPPTFTIGILQNPVFTRYLDIYLIASEYLSEMPVLKVAGQSVPLVVNNPEAFIYKGDFKLTRSGNLLVEASGKDLAGNTGSSSKNFSAQLMRADQGGTISSTDGRLHLTVPPFALRKNTFLTIVAKTEQSSPDSGSCFTYQLGPPSLSLASPILLAFHLPDGPNAQFQLQQQLSNGGWHSLPSQRNGSVLTGSIQSLGTIRLVQTESVMPTSFVLHQNFPNPFSNISQQTRISYELPEKQRIKIVIYNLLGEKVRTLVEKELEPGFYQSSWDGRDRNNHPVPSGVYFYRMITRKQVLTQKMLVLR